jgi:hypothetical protein
MAKSISVLPKKRGRPATGQDPILNFRAPAILTAKIDKWAAKQEDHLSRSEAIRRLLELALSGK